jgi:hypothetical protein
MDEQDCVFLIRITGDSDILTYEAFINFILPRSKKGLSSRLIKVTKQSDPKYHPVCSYEVICTFAKLLEIEIQMKNKINNIL